MVSKTKDFFVNVRFTEDIYKELHSKPHKASKIVREAVKAWLNYYKFEEKELVLSDENYGIIASSGSGKTTLVKSLLKDAKVKKIIIDPGKEYSELGDVIKLTYEKPIAEQDFVFKMWSEKESKIIETYLDNVGTESVVVQPDFDIQEADAIFLKEILETLLKVDDNNRRIIVFEAAEIYQKALPLFVSQCRKKGIQSVVVSELPLMEEIMMNITPVIGSTSVSMEGLPVKISETAMMLKPYEWIWFDRKSNTWNRYKTVLPETKADELPKTTTNPKTEPSKTQNTSKPAENKPGTYQIPGKDGKQPKFPMT